MPTIAALKTKAARAWASTSRRMPGEEVVTSETYAVIPTVKAR